MGWIRSCARLLGIIVVIIVVVVMVWVLCFAARSTVVDYRHTRSRLSQTVGACTIVPVLYAHRGGICSAPENTLAAFRDAVAHGAEGIETDVQLTVDGHPVLCHDSTGARVCGQAATIGSLTLEQVRRWDLGYGYGLTTLEEALLALPTTPFSVDIKSKHPNAPRHVIDVINRCEAAGRVILTSFRAATLRRVRDLGYTGRTGLAQTEVIKLLLAPAPILRSRPLQGVVAQLPCTFFELDLCSKAVVDRCHGLGLEVQYWTANEPELIKRLMTIGADGIVTDHVAVARRALDVALVSHSGSNTGTCQ